MKYSFILIGLLSLLILSSFRLNEPAFPFLRTKEIKVAGWHSEYDVKFYKVDIKANDSVAYVDGNVTILSEIKVSSLSTFIFELYSKLTIDSIKTNDQKLTFNREGDLVKVNLLNKYLLGDQISITIYYKGSIAPNGFFSPVSNRTDSRWKIPVTWSLSQPLSAKYWFPCKQSLADKADSAWIFLTVPKRCKAGSNGLLTKITPIGTSKVRYEWKTTYPIAYYLISFSIAEYKEYSFYAKINDQDSVLIQNYIYNRSGFLDTYKENIDETKQLLKYYSSIYGDYPFYKEKYGHCVAPMGGGMENQTMTTLSSFEHTLVAHELAHQWFGDFVTCATWQDIWINEGFASYSEYLALERLKSVDEAFIWIRMAQQSALNEPNGSIYVPLEESENDSRIFNQNLSYKKGALIIHMLRYELSNDSLFFKVLRNYLSTYKNSVATGENFFDIVNKTSGADYNWFKDQWFYGKGYPNFDISWKYSNDQLMLYSDQKSSSPSTPFFRTHFDIRVFFNGGDTIIRLLQDKPQQLFTVSLNKEVIDIDFDPKSRLLKKVKIDKVPDLPSSDNYFQASPNPFSSELFIRFNNLAEKDRTIKIIDLKGKPILEYNAQRKKDIKFNTNSWAAGGYLVYVSDGSTRYIRKVLKTR